MAISPEVATLFLEELAKRKLPVTLNENGNYVIEVGERKLNISLENVSRDFERDRDPERIVHFVDSITSTLEIPDWDRAQSRIRWQPEPADHEFGDTFHDFVSEKVALVLVYADPTETQIKWLSPADAANWNKTRDELWETAAVNMDQILSEATLEMPSEEHQLGMLSTELVAFKAALLFCPALREAVEPVFGWPVFAVMPCRDFVYVLGQKDQDLLESLGTVVVEEYEQSGYPISTEVFEITDDGISAIGDYERASQDEEGSVEDEDGMKTVVYRGGIVTFRIPAFWTEEYDEDGGGIFYDEDSETSTLRLNVLTFAAKEPVTTRTAYNLLDRRKDKENGEVFDLGNGNALLRSVKEVTEDGEALIIHYWQIANVVPPGHVRIAIFSCTVLSAMKTDEEVVEEIAMLDRELRLCTFAHELGS